MHRVHSRMHRMQMVSSRALQTDRSLASNVAASVSVTTYGISNIAETLRSFDALQKKCLLNPCDDRTTKNTHRLNACMDAFSAWIAIRLQNGEQS